MADASPQVSLRADVARRLAWPSLLVSLAAVCMVGVYLDAGYPPRSQSMWWGLAAVALALLAMAAHDALLRRLRAPRIACLAVLQLGTLLVLASCFALWITPVCLLLVPLSARIALWTSPLQALAWVLTCAACQAALFAVPFPLPVALASAGIYLTLQWAVIAFVRATITAEETGMALSRANAELQSTGVLLEETVRDRERLRIARDLHDVTGHKLAALQINLQIVEGRFPDSEPVRTAARLSAELLDDTRAIVRQIGLDNGLSLDGALARLAEALPAGMLRVEVDEGVRIRNGEAAQLVLRAVQEGVANALRHGHAAHIQVSLRRFGGELVLRVRDDGRGSGDAQAGFGLAQLRQRAQALGGRLALLDAPGGGAELELVLPGGRADA